MRLCFLICNCRVWVCGGFDAYFKFGTKSEHRKTAARVDTSRLAVALVLEWG